MRNTVKSRGPRAQAPPLPPKPPTPSRRSPKTPSAGQRKWHPLSGLVIGEALFGQEFGDAARAEVSRQAARPPSPRTTIPTSRREPTPPRAEKPAYDPRNRRPLPPPPEKPAYVPPWEVKGWGSKDVQSTPVVREPIKPVRTNQPVRPGRPAPEKKPVYGRWQDAEIVTFRPMSLPSRRGGRPMPPPSRRGGRPNRSSSRGRNFLRSRMRR